MPSLLQDAVGALIDSQLATAGIPIKYRVGNLDCELIAILGQSTSEDYGADGSATVARLHDWIVKPSLLAIEGEVVKPELGHLVLTEDGRCFAVAYAGGENCWRYTDQARVAIRIHTVETALPEDSDG